MTSTSRPLPSAMARRLLLTGGAPAGMRVSGHLDLSGRAELAGLPAGLHVHSLDLSGCANLRHLPAGLAVRHLYLDDCTRLARLPPGLACDYLQFRAGRLQTLPADLAVTHKLDLQDCTRLTALPEGLRVRELILRNCTALAQLPRRLDVCLLDIGRCPRLDRLPEGLRLTGWLDLAHTGITSVPEALRGVRLRWNGVFVDERIAFRPETLTAAEVLAEANVERRRVLLERLGYDRFFQEVRAEVLDTDHDPGGERRLLRVPLSADEDLVCLLVRCPSTGKRYVLRVPPGVRSCRQAAAWAAGFDEPDGYRPVRET